MAKPASRKQVTPEQAANMRAYVLMRDDMPSLGRGKQLAHSFHAGGHLTYHLVVLPMMAGKDPDPLVMAWHGQGGGFGTAVALDGESRMDEALIRAITRAAIAIGQQGGVVVDDTYPYLVDAEMLPLIREDLHTSPPKRVGGNWLCTREETTCGWVLGDKDELAVLLGRYGLMPND